MKLLFIGEEPWYEAIIKELRKDNEVHYIFRSSRFRIDKGDYHIPNIFGFYRGYVFLTYLLSSCLLFKNKYDVCITDYKSTYFTTIFPILKKIFKCYETTFIYDVRTIPVGYPEHLSTSVEKNFSKRLKYAIKNFQGITVITAEMKKYLENRYFPFEGPVGIWESGVDTTKFVPMPKDEELKKKKLFNENDFICFYHGSLGYKRGIVELVESFKYLKSCDKRIKLLVVGRGESYKKSLELIRVYDLHETVKIHDWINYDEIPKYISIADLCIIPLEDIDWWRVSSPLKLMEYIACGKNILLTDIIAHINVVGRNKNYYWLTRVNAESFAERIEEAFTRFNADPSLYCRNGLEERSIHLSKISWESRSQTLMQFLFSMKQRHNTNTIC